MTVQQKLMRHADPSMTVKYGDALDATNREANRKVVRLVRRQKTQDSEEMFPFVPSLVG